MAMISNSHSRPAREHVFKSHVTVECRAEIILTIVNGLIRHALLRTSGRPGSKFSLGRDRDRDRNENSAGTRGPGLASSRPGPGPGFFQHFSISVKMKQCLIC